MSVGVRGGQRLPLTHHVPALRWTKLAASGYVSLTAQRQPCPDRPCDPWLCTPGVGMDGWMDGWAADVAFNQRLMRRCPYNRVILDILS